MSRSRSLSPVRPSSPKGQGPEFLSLQDQIIGWYGEEYRQPVVSDYRVKWKKWNLKAEESLREYKPEKYAAGVWSRTGLVCFFIEMICERNIGHVELQLLLNPWTQSACLEETGFQDKLNYTVEKLKSEKCGDLGRKLEFHLNNRIPFAYRISGPNKWTVRYSSMLETYEVKNSVHFSFSTLPTIPWRFEVGAYRRPAYEKRKETIKQQASAAMLAIETLITENLPALAEQGFVPPKLAGVSVFDKYEKDDPQWISGNRHYELVEGELKPLPPIPLRK